MNTLFVLDANFFIQSHRASYPLDVATGFWSKVKMLTHNQKLISIDKVGEEIYKKEDEIKKWCVKNLPVDFFLDTQSQEIIQNYGKVINWANSMRSQYTDKAIEEFSEYKNADAWLIAFGLTDKDKFTMVTYETSEPQRKNKIKIPDVCNHFGIKWVDVVEMFRQLGETF
jgi:hypothetical protein